MPMSSHVAPIDEPCAQLWEAAREAGRVAAETTIPDPMGVRDTARNTQEVIAEGAFGTAHVVLAAGQPFANWIVRTGHGSRQPRVVVVPCGYRRGTSPDFSLERSRAFAQAFRKTLEDAATKVVTIVEYSD